MIHIDKTAYHLIADKLRREIGTDDYYSGEVVHQTPEYDATLTSTLIIYRSTHTAPDRTFTTIDDIVPVWWEFHTFNQQGEILNDFSFTELRNYLK